MLACMSGLKALCRTVLSGKTAMLGLTGPQHCCVSSSFKSSRLTSSCQLHILLLARRGQHNASCLASLRLLASRPLTLRMARSPAWAALACLLL